MKAKDAIIQRNLEFIYKRNTDDVKLHDPDKVAYVRSEPQTKGYAKDEAIIGFSGEWEPLLPAHKCEVVLKGDSLPYPSFEHALHASKFIGADDRNVIRLMNDIVDVKRYVSRHKADPSKVKADWADVGLEIGKKLLRDKFMRSRALKMVLMKTGHKKLIHLNDYNDQYWGVTPAHKGQNHLGLLLQQIRQEIDHGSDIDTWIQDHLILMHKEDVRAIVDIDDPVNDAVRRRIAMAQAKQKAAKAASKNSGNGNNKNGKENEVVEEPEIGDPNHIQFENKNIVFFGSADFNDVVIIDGTASRIHAALVIGSDRVAYVVDLGSSNGTVVGDGAAEAKPRLAPFTFHPIAPAATISISDTGDLQPSVIHGSLLFGHSPGTYRLTIHTNATDLRQAELLQTVNAKPTANDAGYSNSENTIFIRNLDPSTTDDELLEFLSSCGAVESYHIPRDRVTQQATRGIAFVTFSDSYSVYQALTLDGDPLKNSYVKIKRSDAQGGAALPAGQSQSRDGGGRGHGGRGSGDRRRPTREDIANNAMRMSGGSSFQTQGPPKEVDDRESRYREARDSRDRRDRRDERERGSSRDRADRSDRPSRRDQRSRSRSRDRRRERSNSRDDRRNRRDDSRDRRR